MCEDWRNGVTAGYEESHLVCFWLTISFPLSFPKETCFAVKQSSEPWSLSRGQRDGPLFFWRGGMENIEKIFFQGLKLQNKLLANMIWTSFPGFFLFPPGRTKYPGNEVDNVVCIRARDNVKLKCTQCSCLGKIPVLLKSTFLFDQIGTPTIALKSIIEIKISNTLDLQIDHVQR